MYPSTDMMKKSQDLVIIEEEIVHLGHTSSKRDGPLLVETMHEPPGHSSGAVAHFWHGENRHVETRVLVNEGDGEAVHKEQ